MRSKAFLKTHPSQKRRLYPKRSKRRRFPFQRKYKKKSSKLGSIGRKRRRFVTIKRKAKDVAQTNLTDKAQDQGTNVDELIENMLLLHL